jgi:GntR family transcriptional regulator, hexuronate regulon transcriptional repressor
MSTIQKLVRPVKQRRLYEQIAEKISREIDRGDYVPGDRLPPERDLALRFEVGRPTVREALIALEIGGYVDVRTGSGVYVLDADQRRRSQTLALDIGPLELIEARAMIESEAAAMAAALITDDELDGLEAALAAMQEEDRLNISGELADRDFHVRIARATRNSAMVYVIESLWDARRSSPLVARSLEQIRAAGVRPRIDEHQAVFLALKAHDPDAARAAMREHLRRVINDLLEATEAAELEATMTRVRAKRERFGLVANADRGAAP